MYVCTLSPPDGDLANPLPSPSPRPDLEALTTPGGGLLLHDSDDDEVAILQRQVGQCLPLPGDQDGRGPDFIYGPQTQY